MRCWRWSSWCPERPPRRTDSDRRRGPVARGSVSRARRFWPWRTPRMAGNAVPADFRIRWQNEFLKAQQGTFVPFTLAIDAAGALPGRRPHLCPGRAAAPNGRPTPGRRAQTGSRQSAAAARPTDEYPVDAIFPARAAGRTGRTARRSAAGSRSPRATTTFTWWCGSARDPAGRERQPKAAVLKQPLSVPDFRAGELTTSSVILADRLDVADRAGDRRRAGRAAVRDRPERDHAGGRSDVSEERRADGGVPGL